LNIETQEAASNVARNSLIDRAGRSLPCFWIHSPEGSGRLGVEPMDRAPDGDNIEGAELRGRVLEPTLDEDYRRAGAVGRGPRRLHHRRLRIDADDLPAIGLKSDRQDARASPDIEQALAAVEAESFCSGGKERRPIGRPSVLLIGDGGSETSHSDPAAKVRRVLGKSPRAA
jgi:hypothetical protein